MTILPSLPRGRKRLHSFTLVELLTVITIISILSVLSLTAYNQIVRSQTITTTVQTLTGILDAARQSAITRNSRVEFRLYQLPDYSAATTAAPTVYRAFQTFLITGNATNALTKVYFFQSPAIVSSNATVSSVVGIPTVAGSTFTQGSAGASTPQLLPVYQANYNAVVFDFSPTGGLEPAGTLSESSQWYMSLYLENDPIVLHNLPKNFATIQIDPFSGQTKTFRP